MFKLAASPVYFWPVSVSLPTDGGKFEKSTFDAQFKRIPQSRIDAIFRADDVKDEEVARELLVGWRGVTDDSGEDVPFSEAAREQLFNVPGVRAAVIKSYLESLSGAKQKN